MGEWMCRSTFLDLGTSWRWVVSFTSRPHYRQGKSPRYPLDRRLGGPQSQSRWHGEVKILATTWIRTPTPWSSSPQPVAIPTDLSWLSLVYEEETKILNFSSHNIAVFNISIQSIWTLWEIYRHILNLELSQQQMLIWQSSGDRMSCCLVDGYWHLKGTWCQKNKQVYSTL
jgi:hypothetical protein